MTRSLLLIAGIACLAEACAASADPALLDGTYTLVSENDQPLPADPFAPDGCCLTLSGSVAFTGNAYDLHTSHRNKNTSVTFDNSEHGTYTREGDTLTFTRTGGGGANVPYLLAPGTVSDGEATVTLLYGDEGPGSNQVRGSFQR